MLAYNLANCILDGMGEFRKTEMGITAVILGLLPTILQLVGPSIAEVSVLATRRPLLAFLLSVAMPSVTTGGPMENPAEALQRSVDVRIVSGILAQTAWPWLLISAAEYLIAAAAVANVFYLLYQLAFFSVSVSSIAIYSGIISQAYAPFLWVLLLIPAQLFGFWGLKLRYRPSELVNNPGERSERKTWVQVIAREFVPCAKGDPLLLTEVKKGFLFIVVRFFTELSSVVMFVFGTVALSSQIFISLGDVVPLIARLMFSTLVCRSILLFELHGLREVTSQSLKGDTSLPGGNYTPVHGQDRKDLLTEEVRVV
jgi:hypothetical protein